MKTGHEIEMTARPGAFSQFDIDVMLPYLRALKPGQVYLEVGVDQGRSLKIARQETSPEVHVYGVDIKSNPKIARTNFIRGDSREVQIDKKVDLIFIDGDHSYKGVKADIENWYPQMAENGVMLFHDCDDTSPGVVKAAREFAKKISKPLWEHPDPKCSMAVIKL